jgi:hypothetical protein
MQAEILKEVDARTHSAYGITSVSLHVHRVIVQAILPDNQFLFVHPDGHQLDTLALLITKGVGI